MHKDRGGKEEYGGDGKETRCTMSRAALQYLAGQSCVISVQMYLAV